MAVIGSPDDAINELEPRGEDGRSLGPRENANEAIKAANGQLVTFICKVNVHSLELALEKEA